MKNKIMTVTGWIDPDQLKENLWSRTFVYDGD
jgi:hypothetical protein